MDINMIFFLTLIFIFLSIFVETIFLILQLKGNYMTKYFGERAFAIHAITTLLLWCIAAFFIVLLQLEPHPIFHEIIALTIVGIILLIIGGVISSWGYIILGLKRSLCLNFYKEDVPIEEHKLFKYIKHPQDYGFWTLLAGFALFTGSIYNLIIFIEYVVIMVPHNLIESRPLKR
jgi:protein-S-isoprenylcysteine O-methyltransferase Ste14